MGAGFDRASWCATVHEDPDVPAALLADQQAWADVDPAQVTYILSNNTPDSGARIGDVFLRRRVFAYMSRNALRPTQFFRLP